MWKLLKVLGEFGELSEYEQKVKKKRVELERVVLLMGSCKLGDLINKLKENLASLRGNFVFCILGGRMEKLVVISQCDE